MRNASTTTTGQLKKYVAFFIELLYARFQANTALVFGDVQPTRPFVAEELFHGFLEIFNELPFLYQRCSNHVYRKKTIIG